MQTIWGKSKQYKKWIIWLVLLALAAAGGVASVIQPDLSVKWQVGDKAQHGKWGIGTVVSVRGQGEEIELKIAFPGQGIKGLMQKYAPIAKA